MAEAALRLSVTPQTIRNWVHEQKLGAKKDGREWQIDAESFEALAATKATPVRSPEIEERLDRLAEAVERLAEHESSSQQLLAALGRERDRFRAEAAAAKEAALRVNAAAGETDVAVRHLLEVLALQSEALTQLLAPSSAADVLAEGT